MFIFSLAKGEHINYLIGTQHDFNFKDLPEKVQQFLLSKNQFVLEHPSVTRDQDALIENGYISVSSSAETTTALPFDILTQSIMGGKIQCPEMVVEKINREITEYTNKKDAFKNTNLTFKGLILLAHLCKYQEGMDAVLEREVMLQGKAIRYLEDSSIAHKHLLSLTNIGGILLVISLGYEKSPDLSDAKYKNGKLSYKDFETIDVDPEIYKDRNSKWLSGGEGYKGIHEIHTEIDKGIICVGALHLFGTDGVLFALFNSGYNISRLDSDLLPMPFTAEDLALLKIDALIDDLKTKTHEFVNLSEYDQDVAVWTAIQYEENFAMLGICDKFE